MKILKLILKNFSAIKNAMESYEIELDLSNTVNKICLIIGENGSGKTTLLSLLNPFADVGNLDIRNGNNLILEDKDGYKEIHIKNEDDLYIIKHYYFHHKGKNHSVKSYIEKNGVELNVNGNVTSFKEIVKEELQIEPDYLKLIRLGSNVTSLIDLSTTERKNFMSKIMDDIGVFLDYYKSVNTKLRQLSEMISHTVDKINRLNIIDKDEFKKEIEELKGKISEEEEIFIKENNKLALYKNTISNIEDPHTLKDRLKTTAKKYNKMQDVLSNKKNFDSLDANYYAKSINDTNQEIEKCNNIYNSNIMLIKNSLQNLNTMEDQLHNYDVQLTKENEKEKELKRMNEHLNTLRLRLREYEASIGDFKPEYTKYELDRFIVFLKNTQQILGRTYEFGKKPIQRVINLMRENKNVINYINRHLIDLEDNVNDDRNSLFMSTLQSRISAIDNGIMENCSENCEAKRLYTQIKTLLENAEVEDKNENESFYRDMEFVHSNLITILPRFAEYKELIDKLPKDIKESFRLENIYKNIEKLSMIYDDRKINDLMSITTEYDNYINLLKEYAEEEENVERFKNFSGNSSIAEMMESTAKIIKEIRDNIKGYRENNVLLVEKVNEYKRTLDTYIDIKETLDKYEETKELYHKLNEDYETLIKTGDNITNTEIQIARIKITIENMNTELQRKISSLDQYNSLNKELKHLNGIYDDMTLIKDSLSSKQGMPLHFISNYLSNTEEITNELLKIAYDGRIYIDQFQITANEFSIPFYNRGVRLDDVKYSSQGELSFLSIALSFALSRQALSKYNIMLLDEIDGPLDSSNREKFIRILENQIDKIQSEQNFLITHNDMFSSYPVDIIDLSHKDNSENYPLANIIRIKKVS